MIRSFTVAAATLTVAAALAAADLPRCDVAPGWTQSGPARSYAPDTLYDYMDGNSEGYLIYGFKQMRGVTCRAGAVSFVVDISEMNDAESGWGLYASNRDPRLGTESIGISGQIVPQRGIFVKGSRFVEISATPTSQDHSATLRTFLRAMESSMEGTASAPGPVTWFPRQALDPASIRLIPQSVLGLSALKKGYVAKYDYGRAFVVRQPTADAAIQVVQKLRERFGETQSVKIADEAFQGNDRYLGRLIVFRKGAYVGGFVNLGETAPGDECAKAFAAAIP
jgi:hypothetical protein